jgi:hypothetical protein
MPCQLAKHHATSLGQLSVNISQGPVRQCAGSGIMRPGSALLLAAAAAAGCFYMLCCLLRLLL